MKKTKRPSKISKALQKQEDAAPSGKRFSAKEISSKAVSKKSVQKASKNSKSAKSKKPRAEASASQKDFLPGEPSALELSKNQASSSNLESASASTPQSIFSEYDHLGELPESYGTGRLFLTARDPYWIYAYWDYSWQQMEEMRRAARHGELKLRIYHGKGVGAPLHQEINLNHGIRDWFIHVGMADTHFHAEFGYYDWNGCFLVTSRSKPAHTPSNRLSDKTEARFVTIPFHFSFHALFEIVKNYFKDGEELADVLYRLQRAGFHFPFDYEMDAENIDVDALMQMFGEDLCQRIRMGSEELTRWLRRRLSEQTSSGLFSVSSPFGSSFGAHPSRGFWFKVNAELIVYGMTDPKAQVTFDGKKIALNPEGAFWFQFALPDGVYETPISATSPDGVETREVDLHFVRHTTQRGEVGVVPHLEGLEKPSSLKSDAEEILSK